MFLVTTSLTDAWQVLLLYVIPIGGGIPAGVMLAHAKGMSWPVMAGLYFISDVLLACVFDPVVHTLRKNPRLTQFKIAYKDVLAKTVLRPGIRPGPVGLIFIAFGADPMTGRLVNLSLGHGFFTGWAIAITGDMFFFFLVMASTLGLNEYVGDPTWTAIIITVLILGAPISYRRMRTPRQPTPS